MQPGGLSGPLSFFAVFDGHGGKKCSEYAREHLLENLQYALAQSISVDLCLSLSFTRTEHDFFDSHSPKETSGTTALAFLLSHSLKRIWIANAGDSRAVLCRNGKAIALSTDHRADNEEEVHRVIDAGGFVRDNRAMGRMECFRSLGDADVDCKVVTSVPEVSCYELEEGDSFFVLGCDGLFDVMTNQEVVDFVSLKIKGGHNAKDIAQQICHEAINSRFARDNVTAIIIRMQSVHESGQSSPTAIEGVC